MVYVTGDLHGDAARLKSKAVKKLRKTDILIVLGDFGFLWNGSDAEKRLLKKLGKTKYQLLFLPGCHENYDLLREYPSVDFAGGKARQISGKLHMLEMGQIYQLDGKTILTFGGGESEERDPAYEGKRWWRAELPTDQEMAACLDRLEAAQNTVDYILTHDAPAFLLRFMQQELHETSWFQNWLGKLQPAAYKRWLFGRTHKDLALSPKATAVYQNVIPLE